MQQARTGIIIHDAVPLEKILELALPREVPAEGRYFHAIDSRSIRTGHGTNCTAAPRGGRWWRSG